MECDVGIPESHARNDGEADRFLISNLAKPEASHETVAIQERTLAKMDAWLVEMKGI
jgi:hypothetical protein